MSGDKPTATRADTISVADVMSPSAYCVTPDVSIETVRGLMIDHGISGVPVVDFDGKPIGMVSKTDLVAMEHDDAGLEVHANEELRQIGERGMHADQFSATAAEVMTPVAFTVDTDTSLSQAAALMAYQAVHRVPVVDNEGRVVGILSALDILRWLGEEDGYLYRADTPSASA
ncbi:MAG: CBS domain-containing protein [Deltaproteobacteria bacterium]|nr:CBS domain-containing protein [Deltaproteobacteria bacterium]